MAEVGPRFSNETLSNTALSIEVSSNEEIYSPIGAGWHKPGTDPDQDEDEELYKHKVDDEGK